MGRAKISKIKGFPRVSNIELKLNADGIWRSELNESSVEVETEEQSNIELKLEIDGNPPVRFEDGESEKIVGSQSINGDGTFEFTWGIIASDSMPSPQQAAVIITTKDLDPPGFERFRTRLLTIKKEGRP